jgi:hypothetical protein
LHPGLEGLLVRQFRVRLHHLLTVTFHRLPYTRPFVRRQLHRTAYVFNFVILMHDSAMTSSPDLFSRPLRTEPIVIGSLAAAFTLIPLQYIMSLCARNFTDYLQQIFLLHLLNSFIPALISGCVQMYLKRWYETTGLAYDWYRSLVYLIQFCCPAVNLLYSVQKTEAFLAQQRLCRQLEKQFLAEVCESKPTGLNYDLYIPMSQNNIYKCCDVRLNPGKLFASKLKLLFIRQVVTGS